MVIQDTLSNNCYKKSLFVIKMNFGRALAIMLSFLSCILIVFTIGKILFNILGLNAHDIRYIAMAPIQIAVMCAYFFAATIFFVFPLMLGIKKWFYELDGDINKPMTVAFDYFRTISEYKKAVAFQFQISIRRFAVFAAAMVPIAIIRYLAIHISNIGGIMGGILVGIVILVEILALIICIMSAIYINFRYFLAPFLLFQSPLEKSSVLISRSVKLMPQSKKQEITNLYLSLCPFYLICFLIIPLFFLLPYIALLTSSKAKEILAH